MKKHALCYLWYLRQAPLLLTILFYKKYARCMDESGGVTASMLDCIGEETMTQDARLNGAYKKLGSQLAPDRKKQLVAAQRLWIQYRDANCRFYADPDGALWLR
ncbi:lysozyme inhibitor LprI family protein [Plesiomonas shigelloides subsp. oncorhynchi]|nr:lysozyme inhibitor LprI family protein [Plesiomonas shigelloides]